MDALEVLIEEHEIILKAIDILNKSAEELQERKKISSEFFEKLLDIIRNFADKCHHGKEENVLFPLIRERDAKQDKVISLFLEDHEKGRKFIRGINESLGKNDIESIIDNAEGYVNLLPLHIKKENAIFPIWINSLSKETRGELLKRFEEIEEKVIGLGKHEEYVRKIEVLKDYL